jgi:hypothetical protein
MRPSQHNPRELHKEWADATTRAIKNVLDAVEHGDDARIAAKVHDLLEVHSLALAEPGGSNGVRARLRRLEQGQPVLRVQAEQGRRRRQPEAHRQARRVHTKPAQGSVLRAAAALAASITVVKTS